MEHRRAFAGVQKTGISTRAVEIVTPSAPIQPVRIDCDAFYSQAQLADLLGVKPDTLRRDRQTRSDLPYCVFHRRIYYKGSDIIAYLEASRRRSTSDRAATI